MRLQLNRAMPRAMWLPLWQCGVPRWHQPCSAPLWPCPQILSRYDIALVQEVRDSHLTAVGKLLDNLNQWVTVAGS